MMLAVAVADSPMESTTFAVIEKLFTAVVGVPVMTPVELFKVRPAGSALIENMYGAMPPCAVSEPL